MTWEEAVRWCMGEPSMAALARAAYFDAPVQAALRYEASAEFGAIKALLPVPAGRALDLGAGNGIVSHALAKQGWTVTAVEPDASDLVGAGAIRTVARETSLPITVIEAFGEAIPEEAGAFDLVVARQVLHHAHDLPAFCREMSRLARRGATIMTLRDHVISGPGQLEPFLKSHPLHHLYGGENAFNLPQYREALTDAGLVITSELNSFQSVLNYDPMGEDEIRDKLAAVAGPLRGPVRAGLSVMPFAAIAAVAAALDRRPGRLVSFVCRKEAA
jgi:SAM-dependent methyltransferase